MMKKSLKLYLLTFLFLIATAVLPGCARQQPQASPEQVQAILGALGSRNQHQRYKPAIDFSTQPKIALSRINNDSIGLGESLADCLEDAGIELVTDPTTADVVLSGTVQYVGDPDDHPSQFNRMRKQAQASGAVTSAASVGMGVSSPLRLVSSSIGLLSSAATEAMKPNEVQCVMLLHVRQGEKIWNLDLNQTIEAPAQAANQKLAEEMAHVILSQLGG